MNFSFHQLPVFRGLSEEHLRLLEALMETYHCPGGMYVIRQDSPADYLYLILRGSVEISFKPYDGVPITVSHVESGGIFGWSAVVGSRKYTSSAISIGDLDAVRVHGRELRKLCADKPEAGKQILNSLANAVSSRWRDAHDQVKLILEEGMK